MAVVQLTELVPMKTPLGDGWAIVLEATAHDYFWTVALENGALVTFTQDKIRIARCYTYHRGFTDEQMKKAVEPREGH